MTPGHSRACSAHRVGDPESRIQCIVRIAWVGEDLLEDLGIAETIDPSQNAGVSPTGDRV